MARIEGLELDVHGFPTEVRGDNSKFGRQTFHYHAVTKADGSMGAAYWHWTADVHMGHGDKALRASIVAGRLIEATPQTAKAPAVTLATVLEQEQADVAAMDAWIASESDRAALLEFSGMTPADAVEAASFITSGKAKTK